MTTLHLPLWAWRALQAALAYQALATLVASACAHIPPAALAAFDARLPRAGALRRHLVAMGHELGPAARALYEALRGTVRFAGPAALVLLALGAGVAGCAGAQTPGGQAACALARAGDAALDTVVSAVVSAVTSGRPVDPGTADAVDVLERIVHAAVPAACPLAARLPRAERVREAIAAHPPPRPAAP